jgi:hypothetical protein
LLWLAGSNPTQYASRRAALDNRKTFEISER